MNNALTDLMNELDTDGNKIITATEINAQKIGVIGYSWGAIEATNFTRMISAPNAHLLGSRQNNGSGKNPILVTVGGYNLSNAVPVAMLCTIDPIQHAVLGLSYIIKHTDGPLGNVVKFRNYYETKGMDASVATYDQAVNTFQGIYSLGNYFTESIMGEALKNGSQDQPSGTEKPQIDITTDASFANKSVKRYFDEDESGYPLNGVLKGNGVQHDTMPFYLYDQVVSDFNNS